MVKLDQVKIESNKAIIISLLSKINRLSMRILIDFLESSDYFTAPASTKYHGASEGYLAEHSLNVYDLLREKNKRFNLGLTEDNMIISALLHDLCKVNLYIKENKGTETEPVITYSYKDNFPVGHGEKSIIIAQKFIELEDVEIMLIRWHMGMWEEGTNIKTIGNAMNLYPAIAAMQCADMEASRYLER